MGRPRKHADPAQAATARAERDRQHTQVRAARRIQDQVPRFIPYMPLPVGIPPPTPDQLNLRTDLPSVIALSPRINDGNDVSLQRGQLRLPYRLSPPLPLPASALSPINDEAEGSVIYDNRSPTPYSESSSFRQPYGSDRSSGRSKDGDDVNNPIFEGDGNDHYGTQEVDDIPLATSRLSSSRCQSPAPANVREERSRSRERTTSSSESLNLSSEVNANEEDESEVSVAPEISESIATHLAEQLYQFKGCADHQHQEKEQAFQLSYVPKKHGDMRHLTKHLQGLSNRDATPLPDVLSSSTIMSRGSIPNCNFEQIFEGQFERRTQSVLPSSVRPVIDILSSGTSRHESNSDSAESLPSPGNVVNMIPLSRARRANSAHNFVDDTSPSVTTSPSAAISGSDEESDVPEIDAITPCLEAYHGQSRGDAPKEPSSEISFDVDSTCCFPSSLAIASQGILAYSSVNKAANLSASVHFALCDSTVDANNEVVADSVPLHLVPHYAFGQMVGLPDVLIYIFFPSLRHNLDYKTSTYLSNEDQDIWFDTILLPCRNKAVTSSNKRQHHPPSRRVAELESTAASAEGYAQKISSRQQILRYTVQPEHLDLLWRLICTHIEEAVAEGMPEARFANPLLFITSKNSKLHYMESGPPAETLDLLPRAFDRWHRAWTAATNSRHYTPETLFIDVAKQTTSSDSELPPAPVPAAKLWPEVYTWKKCCLDTYLKERVRATRGSGRRSGTGNYPHVAHYPFATLRDTGGMTVASQYGSLAERSGLLYTQFYNLVKNAFDAAKVYPFENEALENIALDPDYVASLKHVGKSVNTFSIEACQTSYLHSKKRTHAAMLDNQWRSFGTREEHRVSLELALKVMDRWRQWQEGSEGHKRHLEQLRQNVGTPHFYFYSPDMFAFLRAQINRFCFLFEQVYSWLGPSHSLEEFLMMTLALRALRFSYGSSVLAAESTLYKDKWSTQTGRAKEGLGLGLAMAQCGFGWLLPKIEWATFRVRAKHSSQLVVGMPLLHSRYRMRWRQVRDLGDVHMRLHQAQGWALKYKIGKGRPSTGQAGLPNVAQIAKGTAWLSYLTALNIVEFRAEIARHLLMSNKKHPELSQKIVAAETSAGARPSSASPFQQLSYSVAGMSSVFKVGGLWTEPHMATGNKSQITSSWVLVEMLFGWAGTVWTKPRGGWAKKPYRLILRKTFELIERVLGQRTADEWLHHFKLVIMVTHWILPYVTAASFLPLTKSNRNLGQQARTTWFSTVYEEPYREKGYPHTTTEPIWIDDEEPLTLAEATRKAWSRHKISRKSSTEDLVHIIAEAGLELPKLGGHDTGHFQLGRRQIGTNIYPYWENGRPPQWPAVFTLPNLTILELDEYFCQKMDAADRVPPRPVPVVHLKREPVSPTQSLYGLDVHSTGDTSKESRPERLKDTPRLVRNESEPLHPEAIDSIIHEDPDPWDFAIYEDEPDEDPGS